MEYVVVSKWCGWSGGWGIEDDLAVICNWHAMRGWRLVRSENALFAWMWLVPRRKVLLFFERERQEGAPAARSGGI
jgi:hypothetical protein